MKSMNTLRGWLRVLVFLVLFIVLVSNTGMWEKALRYLFPGEQQHIHPRGTLLELVWEHVSLVIISSTLAVIIGIITGVLVTRSFGRGFLGVMNNLSSLGQTFPPVAVLALAVPALGFGFKPTIVALFLYGLLPVLRNTITGIESVEKDVKEAAYGMGMTDWQVLFRVELPLSARIIMAGIRISVVINVGTATVGATIGAGGLGSPIVAGLIGENPAYLLEGAIPAALLAIIIDMILGQIEKDISWNGLSASV